MKIDINPNVAGSTTASTLPSQRASINKQASSIGGPNLASESGVSLSITSRQLALSATAADERDASMTRAELASEAKRLREQYQYDTREVVASHGLPDTDNPELLARAKQATEFVLNYKFGSSTVDNPFSDLSTDQLVLIMNDDSGRFTKNERHAAWLERHDRHEAWAEKVVAQAHLEYQATGQNTHFFQACIDHYKGLSAIEQAQFPADYVQRREFWISISKPDKSFDSSDISGLYDLLSLSH